MKQATINKTRTLLLGAVVALGALAVGPISCQQTPKSPNPPEPADELDVAPRTLNEALQQLPPETQARVTNRLSELDRQLVVTSEPGERVKLRVSAQRELQRVVGEAGLAARIGLREQIHGDPLAERDVQIAFQAMANAGVRYTPTEGDLRHERSQQPEDEQ